MPTTDIVREVAKSGRSEAAKLAKNAARNPAVKKGTNVVVAAVVNVVTPVVTEALSRPVAYRKNRRLAVQLARQIGGTYSRDIIAGDRYWVVWQDETPFEVYPPLPKAIGPLAERRELQNYHGIRTDPSAGSS